MSTPLTNTSLAALAALIRSREKFVVCSHVRPDGDAVGSSVALALAIRKLGKSVHLLCEDGLPANLAFLPHARELVEKPAGPVAADVVFALDTAARTRLGDGVNAAIGGATILINIDHHVSNPGYGDLHYIDPHSPATGQIIYELLREAGLPIDSEIAENLYTAISTDTGSFQYSSTTAHTYLVAARLVECGLDVGELNRKIHQSHPLRRMRLLGELLGVLRITAAGKCASWHLTREMATRAEALPEDTENLIDYLRSIDGVIAAVFFEELADGRVRISLRSKDSQFDANALCARFGGGGHKMAAGARLPGPLEAAQQQVLTAIHEALAEL
jgi:bifunctional oligoribonuclease and PAP phosphatase NrnA